MRLEILGTTTTWFDKEAVAVTVELSWDSISVGSLSGWRRVEWENGEKERKGEHVKEINCAASPGLWDELLGTESCLIHPLFNPVQVLSMWFVLNTYSMILWGGEALLHRTGFYNMQEQLPYSLVLSTKDGEREIYRTSWSSELMQIILSWRFYNYHLIILHFIYFMYTHNLHDDI